MTQPQPPQPPSQRPPQNLQVVTERLKAERIQEMLRQLPDWRLEQDGTAIARVYVVPNLRAGAVFAALVAEVAAVYRQTPEIVVRASAVTVTLRTEPVGGLTQRDFDLAARLEFAA